MLICSVMKDSESNVGIARAPFHMNGALIEPEALRISHKDSACRIEPKVMALLVALCERPGQLWTREELLARIWAGATASDESLTRIVYLLRKALQRVALAVGAVRTVSKLGYRLDAEVRDADQQTFAPPLNSTHFPPFSVAILPVVDMSPGARGKLLADGLTRDLTMLLSRTPQYRVTPYSSAVRLSAQTSNLVATGEALHARFIVTATLVRSGETVRIRADLGDASDDVLLWAEKYETAIDRFFEVQEDVAYSITTAITAKVNATQPVRARRTGRFNLSAYERVLAAEALCVNYGCESARQIVAMLREALQIEPDDPITRAALAVQLSQNVVSQWAEDPAATIAQADALIAQALQAAPSDPVVRADAGVVATMLHRPDAAIRHLELATARNPNDAHALAVLGWQQCLRHADPAGIGLIETAEARAPHHPRFGLWATYRATGHLFMLDYAQGLRGGRQAVERTPHYYQPHLTCAWAHAGLGDTASAQREIQLARELDSQDILEKFVAEMRKWAQNSPNKRPCWEVLEALRCSATGIR